MITFYEGTYTRRVGRLTSDITIAAAAVVDNDGEIFTYTTLSEGEITGNGTLTPKSEQLSPRKQDTQVSRIEAQRRNQRKL
ncbi:MAG: hypothetical protein LBU65_05485 [Planctomycetaceae bacterium]|nr:hypothetical protein [Planctomycetaceae bacterium]